VDWSEGDRVLVEPRKARSEQNLGENLLVFFIPEDLKYFLSLFPDNYQRLEDIFLSRCYRIGAIGFDVVGPILGAPQAVLVLEKCIARGVRSVLGVGWCGSVKAGVEIGDVILPFGSFSEEGTSSHYAPVGNCKFPDEPRWFRYIEAGLSGSGLRIHRGSVWTTDAPYRETVFKVLFYESKGAIGVDMETSAVFRLALCRGIALRMILLVSDTLYTLKWVPGVKKPVFKNSRKKLLTVLADSLRIRGSSYVGSGENRKAD